MQHRTDNRKIAMRAARSRTPLVMPCGKPDIWQKKLSTSYRKQNPNRSRKSGRNPFSNASCLGRRLRQRENTRQFLRNQAIRRRASRR